MGDVYVSFKAVSGGPNRSDLKQLYSSLDQIPVLSRALDAATSSPPDLNTLALMGQVSVDGSDVVFKTLVCSTLVHTLIEDIPSGSSEIVEVVIHTNHSPWRTRKVRRLTQVVIQKPDLVT